MHGVQGNLDGLLGASKMFGQSDRHASRVAWQGQSPRSMS